MPYRFLEEIAIADVAFEATGGNLEELFVAAADALLNVMVTDPATVRPAQEVPLSLENEALDMLLFTFLNELIFHKDARQLLLRVRSARIERSRGNYRVDAMAVGEPIDPHRHPLVVDVKAVTLHLFQVDETEKGWWARVVLDI
ncbi:MAG TPA: archease [Geobacteraceae bacterium]